MDLFENYFIDFRFIKTYINKFNKPCHSPLLHQITSGIILLIIPPPKKYICSPNKNGLNNLIPSVLMLFILMIANFQTARQLLAMEINQILLKL